ncbi:MAG: phytanoyl-CoA dioxygenase family protein [Acidobacteriia bacterium]|nr:phytanoyl-CoA dioxygenase family protein [Terriglobia bacterium]
MEEPLYRTCALQVAQDGYAIFQSVLPIADIQQLTLKLGGSALRRSRAGVRHLLGNSDIAGLAGDPRLLGIAQSVLGNDAFPFRATLFDKSPDSNWPITWHQDTALPLREKHEAPGWGPWSEKEGIAYAHAPAQALEQVVALRLHLDDSRDDNGPLRVLPETHRQGVFSDQQIEVIAASVNAVTCLVPRGGVIVMRPLIIHASSKSHSDVPRRVIHIEYASQNIVSAPLRLAMA